MQETPGQRGNVSEATGGAVRAMIVDGRLAAGERINEVRLAEKLGVSRTPLREALCGLVAEGALIARPRLGYFVAPLTRAEFEQLYDIRPLLDPEALRLAGVPDAKRMARLEKLNLQLAAARQGERAFALDDAWHFALIESCPNKVLLDLIASIARRTRRYELALMRETESVHRANAEHAQIMIALRKGDLEGACAALKRNMQSGRAPIVAWLKAREGARRVGRPG